jgi:hypothetical protein
MFNQGTKAGPTKELLIPSFPPVFRYHYTYTTVLFGFPLLYSTTWHYLSGALVVLFSLRVVLIIINPCLFSPLLGFF